MNKSYDLWRVDIKLFCTIFEEYMNNLTEQDLIFNGMSLLAVALKVTSGRTDSGLLLKSLRVAALFFLGVTFAIYAKIVAYVARTLTCAR